MEDTNPVSDWPAPQGDWSVTDLLLLCFFLKQKQVPKDCDSSCPAHSMMGEHFFSLAQWHRHSYVGVSWTFLGQAVIAS